MKVVVSAKVVRVMKDEENEGCSHARFWTNNHVTFTNLGERRR